MSVKTQSKADRQYLAGVLAGAANTPIAASVMAIEFFGKQIGPAAAIVCVISYVMTGHRSVYPSQILAVKKSVFVQVELEKEIEEIEGLVATDVQAAKERVPGIVHALRDKLKKLTNKKE